MSKVTLIYISTADCSACVDFESKWVGIKEVLNEKIEIVEIHLKSRRECFLPGGISEYVGWFPTFLLKVGDRTEIFNGEMVDGSPTMKGSFPRTLEGFKRWISLHSGVSFEKESTHNYACYAISAIAANVIALNLVIWYYIL